MSFLSDARDLFGTPISPAAPAEPPAPRWLCEKIERRARSLQVCLPELCEAHAGAGVITPQAMSRDDAEQLNHTLGLMMSMKISKERGKDAARPG